MVDYTDLVPRLIEAERLPAEPIPVGSGRIFIVGASLSHHSPKNTAIGDSTIKLAGFFYAPQAWNGVIISKDLTSFLPNIAHCLSLSVRRGLRDGVIKAAPDDFPRFLWQGERVKDDLFDGWLQNDLIVKVRVEASVDTTH